MSNLAPSEGILFALGSAVTWSFAVILFRKAGEDTSPFSLNLFKSVVGTLLVAATMLVLGIPWAGSPREVLLLLISGALGIGIADTLYFYALNELGAGRLSLVSALFSPLVLVLSSVFLDDPLSILVVVAVALISLSIVVGSLESRGSLRASARGLAAALGSTVLVAISIIMVKPVLAHSDPWWVTCVRFLGGVLLLGVQAPWRITRTELRDQVGSGLGWRLGGTLLGTYISASLWIMGIKHSKTVVAIVLSQTSLVLIPILAYFLLKEPMRPQRIAAVVLGVCAGLAAGFA